MEQAHAALAASPHGDGPALLQGRAVSGGAAALRPCPAQVRALPPVPYVVWGLPGAVVLLPVPRFLVCSGRELGGDAG